MTRRTTWAKEEAKITNAKGDDPESKGEDLSKVVCGDKTFAKE
jgi:hypothetical protein